MADQYTASSVQEPSNAYAYADAELDQQFGYQVFDQFLPDPADGPYSDHTYADAELPPGFDLLLEFNKGVKPEDKPSDEDMFAGAGFDQAIDELPNFNQVVNPEHASSGQSQPIQSPVLTDNTQILNGSVDPEHVSVEQSQQPVEPPMVDYHSLQEEIKVLRQQYQDLQQNAAAEVQQLRQAVEEQENQHKYWKRMSMRTLRDNIFLTKQLPSHVVRQLEQTRANQCQPYQNNTSASPGTVLKIAKQVQPPPNVASAPGYYQPPPPGHFQQPPPGNYVSFPPQTTQMMCPGPGPGPGPGPQPDPRPQHMRGQRGPFQGLPANNVYNYNYTQFPPTVQQMQAMSPQFDPLLCGGSGTNPSLGPLAPMPPMPKNDTRPARKRAAPQTQIERGESSRAPRRPRVQ